MMIYNIISLCIYCMREIETIMQSKRKVERLNLIPGE
jgi:flagellar biosynthesis regulator FlaF